MLFAQGPLRHLKGLQKALKATHPFCLLTLSFLQLQAVPVLLWNFPRPSLRVSFPWVKLSCPLRNLPQFQLRQFTARQSFQLRSCMFPHGKRMNVLKECDWGQAEEAAASQTQGSWPKETWAMSPHRKMWSSCLGQQQEEGKGESSMSVGYKWAPGLLSHGTEQRKNSAIGGVDVMAVVWGQHKNVTNSKKTGTKPMWSCNWTKKSPQKSNSIWMDEKSWRCPSGSWLSWEPSSRDTGHEKQQSSKPWRMLI